MRRAGIVVLVGLAAGVFLGAGAPPQESAALLEAKRRAAGDLLREGKTTEAVALLAEVVRVDKGNFKDQLLLARAYDKLNKTAEATEAYRHASELLTAPATPEDRAARGEIDRRLKVLDAQMIKVRGAEEEFLKKLDILEREVSRDPGAMNRLLRLRAAIYRTQDRRDRGGCEVLATLSWQDSGMSVVAGRTYRVRAAGTCQLTPQVDCTPDGTKQLPPNSQGPRGMLVACIGGSPCFPIGSAARFKATDNGALRFLVNHDVSTKPLSGTVTVVIDEEQ